MLFLFIGFFWSSLAVLFSKKIPILPHPQQSKMTLKEFLGVNAYWGWGTLNYSNSDSLNQGPNLYKSIASYARNYHDLRWDLNHPGEAIDFELMSKNGGTPAKEWLNWDREYSVWANSGLKIQASLQFYGFEQELWRNPYQSAYNYAFQFARHFGPTYGNGLIETIEVGNEPWKYDSNVYKEILLGMSKGGKRGDPEIEIFPCALQASDSTMEHSGIFKNYLPVRIPAEAIPYLDGINVHAYSYIKNVFRKNIGIYPEHPNSTFWEILDAIEWRDKNIPGKKIYLSEWGWDSGGGGENCDHVECVSEKAGAAYAIRGALIAMRLGLDRATWFFFANSEEGSSLYTRSGLTGSVKTNFKKKQSFKVLEKLIQKVGSLFFLNVIQEDDEAWIYSFGTNNNEPTHLIAWRPIDGDVKSPISITLPEEYSVNSIYRFDNQLINSKDFANIEIRSMPVLITLE